MATEKPFTFQISLSVLNHLGRNLYRSFSTVLGEAISNSWDASAKNVWIYIDKEKNNLFIKDDGDGMNYDDFQNKFLKIGYSRRKGGKVASDSGRPYIGRKGIGKLALLSCAEKINVISKMKNGEYIGGVIDNSGLNEAITNDLTPQDYVLGKVKPSDFSKYEKDHEKGTIVYFEKINDGIKNNLLYLRKIIALYFRFSLIDKCFNIFVNDEKITLDDINDLAKNTEFLWNINNLDDPYVKEKLKVGVNILEEGKNIKMSGGVVGFIASVNLPRSLKITDTDERVGIDLFVNGRLRARNILEDIPTAKVPESYLYGQIHFDGLDSGEDKFTSDREGVVANDPIYKEFLENLRKVVLGIIDEWDSLRRKHRKDGDPENEKITRKERKAEELFNVVSEEYNIPITLGNKGNRERVDEWVDNLVGDARYNFSSYAECFISENLIRRFIQDKEITLSEEAKRDIGQFKIRESRNKTLGNVSIELRQGDIELSYLDMDGLSNLVDRRGGSNSLPNDAKQYKPIRDALMHTALLTDEAKRKLTTTFDNIRSRLKTLFSNM